MFGNEYSQTGNHYIILTLIKCIYLRPCWYNYINFNSELPLYIVNIGKRNFILLPRKVFAFCVLCYILRINNFKNNSHTLFFCRICNKYII